MFKFLKNLFNNREKPVIILIHGFGKRRGDEFLELCKHLNEYDVMIPNLFDQRYREDAHWFNWVSRGEEAIINAKKQGRKIILIGYSMGGVIASHLASKFHIEKLILLAPAFEFLSKTTALMAIKTFFAKDSDDKYLSLPENYYATFLDVVTNTRASASKVDVPTLMLHCLDDDVISYQSSVKYAKRIKNAKCLLIPGGSHRLMEEDDVKELVNGLVVLFIKGQL